MKESHTFTQIQFLCAFSTPAHEEAFNLSLDANLCLFLKVCWRYPSLSGWSGFAWLCADKPLHRMHRIEDLHKLAFLKKKGLFIASDGVTVRFGHIDITYLRMKYHVSSGNQKNSDRTQCITIEYIKI